MRIRWAGLEFVGDAGDATYTIDMDGLSGVLDGVDTRFERTERPNADGEFPASAYLSAQLGSISGDILTESPYEYEQAIRRLASIPARDRTRLVVRSAGGTFWRDVQRYGKPTVRPVVYGKMARYMIQWFSPDPWWFGETREFTGPTAQVYHYGNDRATPVIEVTGSLPSGYQVAALGKQWNVTQPLTAGQTHRLDVASGWLYRNGVLQVGAVASAEKFTIPPGKVTPVAFTPVSGSGVMTVKVADTYV